MNYYIIGITIAILIVLFLLYFSNDSKKSNEEIIEELEDEIKMLELEISLDKTLSNYERKKIEFKIFKLEGEIKDLKKK